MSGTIENISIIPMKLKKSDGTKHIFSSKLTLNSGGHYGYTFRAIPKNPMILNEQNLNITKWIMKN